MRKRIGELLVEAGATNEAQVRAALEHQRRWASGMRLGEVLVATGKVPPAAVAKALATQFALPFVEIPPIPAEVAKLVPHRFLEKNRAVPFRLESNGKAGRLHVAIDDPSRMAVIQELKASLGRPVQVHVAAVDDIAQALAVLKGERPPPPAEIELEDASEEFEIQRGGSPSPPLDEIELEDVPQEPEGQRGGAPSPPEEIEVSLELEELLDGMFAAPPVPGPPRVKVVYFPPKPKLAKTPVASAAAQPPPLPLRIEDDDLKMLDRLEPTPGPASLPAPEPSGTVKPTQMLANLLLLLFKKKVVTEREYLDALLKPSPRNGERPG